MDEQTQAQPTTEETVATEAPVETATETPAEQPVVETPAETPAVEPATTETPATEAVAPEAPATPAEETVEEVTVKVSVDGEALAKALEHLGQAVELLKSLTVATE